MSEAIESFGGKDFFLSVVQEQDLLGLSSGYEGGNFRSKGLAELMFNALPDFALTYSELRELNAKNVMERLRRAVKAIYQTEKFKKRGEFGELILHLVMRDYYGSIPAVSKIYYKDSVNDTVKGFDAVHVVPEGDTLSLWLGEAKFYGSISAAISEVVDELQVHVSADYLRNEFLLVSNKIDPSWSFAAKLKKLLDPKTSLDEVFSRLVVPVLLTYDSKITKSHKQVTSTFREELECEIQKHSESFRGKDLPAQVEIVLILIPLDSKESLVAVLNDKLTHLQKGL